MHNPPVFPDKPPYFPSVRLFSLDVSAVL